MFARLIIAVANSLSADGMPCRIKLVFTKCPKQLVYIDVITNLRLPSLQMHNKHNWMVVLTLTGKSLAK